MRMGMKKKIAEVRGGQLCCYLFKQWKIINTHPSRNRIVESLLSMLHPRLPPATEVVLRGIDFTSCCLWAYVVFLRVCETAHEDFLRQGHSVHHERRATTTTLALTEVVALGFVECGVVTVSSLTLNVRMWVAFFLRAALFSAALLLLQIKTTNNVVLLLAAAVPTVGWRLHRCGVVRLGLLRCALLRGGEAAGFLS